MSGYPVEAKRRTGQPLLFLADGDPKRTESFQAGVKQLRQITAAGDRFYFVGDDGKTGDELWGSRGSAESTRLVREFQPGPAGSVIDNLINLKGDLFLTAGDREHGSELWRFDNADGAVPPGATGSLMIE